VNAITGLWKEKRRDNGNRHMVLRDKELGNLMDTIKRDDWDRRRAVCDDNSSSSTTRRPLRYAG
jgi:hypothetical protein